MLSWVNSSEVRRWLQTKIADPKTLRSTSSGQDVFASSISRHNSDGQLTGGAQDGMPGMPMPSHHPDHSWVRPASSAHHDVIHHRVPQGTDKEPHQVHGCQLRPLHVPHGCVLSGHLRSTFE